MAGHQCHLWKVGNIPCAYDQPAAVRVCFYLPGELRDLVNNFSVAAIPASPLFSINRSKLSFFISPFIPDAHAMFFQVSNICFAFQKPKQFINDAFQMQLFCRDQRKTSLKIEPHLIAKATDRSCSGTIRFFNPIVENMLKKIEVLLHAAIYWNLEFGVWNSEKCEETVD